MSSCHHVKKKNKVKSCCAPQPNDSAEMTPEQNEPTIPAVDIIELDNEFVIVADMPGADEETIDVSFNAPELTISGEIEEVDSDEEVVFRCRQFDPGDYSRTFRVGESIDAEKMSADYKDGVLTVHLPKKEELEPRKICVNKK